MASRRRPPLPLSSPQSQLRNLSCAMGPENEFPRAPYRSNKSRHGAPCAPAECRNERAAHRGLVGTDHWRVIATDRRLALISPLIWPVEPFQHRVWFPASGLLGIQNEMRCSPANRIIRVPSANYRSCSAVQHHQQGNGFPRGGTE